MKSTRLVLLGFVMVFVAIFVAWHIGSAPERTGKGEDGPFSHTPAPPAARPPVDDESALFAATPIPSTLPPPAPPVRAPIEVALAETNRFERQTALERLGYDAAVNGFAASIEVLETIERSSDRAAFLRGAFAKLAEGLPLDALRAIKQVPDGPDREAALSALVAHWETDLSFETWKGFLAVQAGVSSLEARQLVRLLGNPALAAEAARELLAGPDQHQLMRMAAGAMAESDPQRALRLADEFQGKERDEVLRAIARAWGRSQGETALAWARQQPDPDLRAELQARALSGWASRQPDQAAARLPELTDLKARQEVLKDIALSWAFSDTKAALAWARSLPDAAVREQALAVIQPSIRVGIGVTLRTSPDGVPVIDQVIPGGPASASGALKPGSQITAISDGHGGFTDLKGMDLADVTKLIRGKAGTMAVLQVVPEGQNPSQRRTVTVPRQQLLLKNETP